MSRTRRYNDKYEHGEATRQRGRQRTLSVRGVRRDEPDLRRMGRALVAFTLAEAEALAEQRKVTPKASPSLVDEPDTEGHA